MSSIEWTDRTWNPTVGCSRVSPGCEHCYAEGVAHRGMQEAHRGLTILSNSGPRWNGIVRLLADRLEAPLRWRKPCRVFVDSMSDLFHEQIPFEYIAAVFAVMAASPRHTFQVLTKRPHRMLDFFQSFPGLPGRGIGRPDLGPGTSYASEFVQERVAAAPETEWPLPNVWLGVSIEDQQRSGERLLPLIMCPAKTRFVSVEPMLGPVELGLAGTLPGAMTGGAYVMVHQMIHWVICGGESGAKAREFNIAWARELRDECAFSDVAFFLKQMGARPVAWNPDSEGEAEPVSQRLTLDDGKGGKMGEWPKDLQVRQWPESHEVHG